MAQIWWPGGRQRDCGHFARPVSGTDYLKSSVEVNAWQQGQKSARQSWQQHENREGSREQGAKARVKGSGSQPVQSVCTKKALALKSLPWSLHKKKRQKSTRSWGACVQAFQGKGFGFVSFPNPTAIGERLNVLAACMLRTGATSTDVMDRTYVCPVDGMRKRCNQKRVLMRNSTRGALYGH